VGIVVFEHRAFNQRNEVVDLRMVGIDADA